MGLRKADHVVQDERRLVDRRSELMDAMLEWFGTDKIPLGIVAALLAGIYLELRRIAKLTQVRLADTALLTSSSSSVGGAIGGGTELRFRLR